MKKLILINCLLLMAIGFYAQQKLPDQAGQSINQTKIITVPEGDCSHISVDGKFDNNEWEDALHFSQPDNYAIMIKADKEFLMIGLKFPRPMGQVVAEIRMTSDDKEVFLLHSSGANGEGVSGFPCTTKFDINNNNLWESNFSVKIPEKEAEWVAAGRPVERYDEVSEKRDGIEYKISRKKLSGDTLKLTIGWIWVEIRDGKPDFQRYNFPVDVSLINSDNWIELFLPSI